MDTKVLFVWPPELPYDLTLHHHFTYFGETAAYFKQFKNFKVDIFDGGVLAYLKKQYVQLLLNDYDFLVILSYVQNVPSAVEAAKLCRSISPKTKILAYGPSCYYVPHIFEQEPFDGYVAEGDFEPAIESFIQYHQGSISKDKLAGVCVDNGKYKASGKWLDPEKWAFPPLDELPLDYYNNIIAQKGTIKKFGDRQISVTITRGCPFHCPFCFASPTFGLKERRRPVKPLIKFIKDNLDKFDNLPVFASNFTLNKPWVFEFCQALMDEKLNIDWRCTTRAELLDEEIVQIMAKSGCKSVGMGVETFQKNLQEKISKRQDKEMVLEKFKLLRKYGIIPKGYIMLGLPGQTKEDVFETIREIQNAGGELRPSAYSPYQELTRNSTLEEISKLDRYSFGTDSIQGMSANDFLKIIFNRDFKETK